jgi:undecaprenyl diphosphate synthase
MHTAIIMDGNGRWAERRGLPRSAGHRAGAKAVRRIVEAATRGPVNILTLYAFSSDNWARPPAEVSSLMRLLKRYLVSETARCLDNGVRLSVIGRRDRLSRDLVRTIENTERITGDGSRLHLRLAVDYSARAAIAQAAVRTCLPEDFDRQLAAAVHSNIEAPVDLLIRTGGERRLSDFLLWESAYAELVFVDTFWPDFDEAAFDAALREFARRDRRFGRVSSTESQPEYSRAE